LLHLAGGRRRSFQFHNPGVRSHRNVHVRRLSTGEGLELPIGDVEASLRSPEHETLVRDPGCGCCRPLLVSPPLAMTPGASLGNFWWRCSGSAMCRRSGAGRALRIRYGRRFREPRLLREGVLIRDLADHAVRLARPCPTRVLAPYQRPLSSLPPFECREPPWSQ
jgi:hypothetical protein